MDEEVEGEFIEGRLAQEDWGGIIQCSECGYWGHMDGWVNPDDEKYILFQCPECEVFEKVRNPYE